MIFRFLLGRETQLGKIESLDLRHLIDGIEDQAPAMPFIIAPRNADAVNGMVFVLMQVTAFQTFATGFAL